MTEIEIPPGTHIEAAAGLLVGRANMIQADVSGRFNGVVLTAKPGDDPARIASDYSAEMAAQAERWRESPEGKRAAEEARTEIANLQGVADVAAAAAGHLDFTNQRAVLAWLGALQPASDRRGVRVDGPKILGEFAKAGLTPNMCCGDAFDPDDRDTYFRWLVGQALDGLQRGPAIHGMFHKFAAEWTAKWGRS